MIYGIGFVMSTSPGCIACTALSSVGQAIYEAAECVMELWAMHCRYADLMRDPDWRSLLGFRKRVLMAKSASVFSVGNAVQSISTNVLKIWNQQQEQTGL